MSNNTYYNELKEFGCYEYLQKCINVLQESLDDIKNNPDNKEILDVSLLNLETFGSNIMYTVREIKSKALELESGFDENKH